MMKICICFAKISKNYRSAEILIARDKKVSHASPRSYCQLISMPRACNEAGGGWGLKAARQLNWPIRINPGCNSAPVQMPINPSKYELFSIFGIDFLGPCAALILLNESFLFTSLRRIFEGTTCLLGHRLGYARDAQSGLEVK